MESIATKTLPNSHPTTGLTQRLDVWDINISARRESIEIMYSVVQVAPNGQDVEGSSKDFWYRRYNAKVGDPRPTGKIVKEDNLKFDALRASQVGQLITGMINLDLQDYDGTSESLDQNVVIE